MLEKNRNVSKAIDHCNGVTRFKQVENQLRNQSCIAEKNLLSLDACMRMEFLLISVCRLSNGKHLYLGIWQHSKYLLQHFSMS